MAVFRIITALPPQKKAFSDHPAFEVEVLSGALSAGLRFRVYETHHPVDYTILAVHSNQDRAMVEVDKPIPWEGYLVGAIIDTNDPAAHQCRGRS